MTIAITPTAASRLREHFEQLQRPDVRVRMFIDHRCHCGKSHFTLVLDKNSESAGAFTFTPTNTGPTAHEFGVFKTELAPDALPLVSDKSKVDENGEGLDHIDEIQDLNVGDTKSLSVNLEPGAYVFICNLPGALLAGHLRGVQGAVRESRRQLLQGVRGRPAAIASNRCRRRVSALRHRPHVPPMRDAP